MEATLLNVLLFAPLFLALGLMAVPTEKSNVFKASVLLLNLIQLTITSLLWILPDWKTVAFGGAFETLLLFETKLSWIKLALGSLGTLHIHYHIGIDYTSALMLWMSSLVFFAATLASWKITTSVKGYFLLLLLLNTSVIGCFLALDLFLFFLFFEFMLLPMYFLIGIWGGVRRSYAAIKFFLYTLVGSLMILSVLVVLLLSATVVDPATVNGLHEYSLSLPLLMEKIAYLPDAIVWKTDTQWLGLSPRAWAFWLMLVGFLIKLPAVPFHTWLPDAHVEAPTPISVILAGVLLKVGAFGIIRLAFGIFPDMALMYSETIGWLGAVAILYGALVALAQDDLKKMIAYASISHMGYVLIGLSSCTPQGYAGAVYQMMSHGLLSSLLFLMAGYVQEQTGTRSISSVSGLFQKIPGFTAVVVAVFFASLGLPGFSAFIAEFMVLVGAFASAAAPEGTFGYAIPIVALIGLVTGAGYFLWALQRMFFGTFWLKIEHATPDNFKEPDLMHKLMWYPLLIASLFAGIFPSFWLEGLGPSGEWFSNMLKIATGQ